jgi:protein gp37
MTGQRFAKGKIPVRLHPDRLEQPLHWRKPRRVFVVSMGDLFHEDVPWGTIHRVWGVMASCPQHTFQVLTKRPERMQEYLSKVAYAVGQPTVCTDDAHSHAKDVVHLFKLPLPNVWLGVSVENQRMAEERIPLLLETPAAVRFLSCEPLLGPLALAPCLGESKHKTALRGYYQGPGGSFEAPPVDVKPPPFIDWVIVGGESGPGRAERKLVESARVRCSVCLDDPGGIPGGIQLAKQRNGGAVAMQRCVKCRGQGMVAGWRPKPHTLEWLCSIREQCQAAGVPFFFKQWGGPKPKAGGRLLDGCEWNEMPDTAVAVIGQT